MESCADLLSRGRGRPAASRDISQTSGSLLGWRGRTANAWSTSRSSRFNCVSPAIGSNLELASAMDDGSYVAQRRKIIQRVAVDDQQVGIEAGTEAPGAVAHADGVGWG